MELPAGLPSCANSGAVGIWSVVSGVETKNAAKGCGCVPRIPRVAGTHGKHHRVDGKMKLFQGIHHPMRCAQSIYFFFLFFLFSLSLSLLDDDDDDDDADGVCVYRHDIFFIDA